MKLTLYWIGGALILCAITAINMYDSSKYGMSKPPIISNGFWLFYIGVGFGNILRIFDKSKSDTK